jgi:hypothetical protein
MDQKSLFYAESARRRARKAKALQEGEEEQHRNESGRKLGPLWEHRPPRPEPAATAPPARATQRRPGARKPGLPPKAGKRARPSAPRPSTAGAARRPTGPAGAPKSKVRPPELRASEERRLLESQELDLYSTGKTATPHVCPQCQHELAKVVCLGVNVRVCVECLGTWLPYPVVQDFASKIDWFRELRPAVQRFRSATQK